MNSQSEICHFKNKEEGKLKGDRERQRKKGTGEGDTVLKCPIFWPSPVFQWNKENSASFFSSFLPPPHFFLSLPPILLSLTPLFSEKFFLMNDLYVSCYQQRFL